MAEKITKDELARIKVRIGHLQSRLTLEGNKNFIEQDRAELKTLESRERGLQQKVNALINAQIKR